MSCPIVTICGKTMCQACGLVGERGALSPDDECFADRIGIANKYPITANEFRKTFCREPGGRPSRITLAWRFAAALIRALWWTLRHRRPPWLAGKPYRERLALCRSNVCGKFAEGRCTACGCGVGAPDASGLRALLGRWLDKPRWPAERCPVGLWLERD